MYVWLGTCDLTSYNKNYISISSYRDEKLTVLSYYYNKYENCKVTILETPVYSICHWNCHRKHKSPDEFKDQDSTLADQVIRLSTKVKELNDKINSHSPKFSNDLQIKSKYKKGDHRTPALQQELNLTSFYTQTEYIQITYWRRPG